MDRKIGHFVLGRSLMEDFPEVVRGVLGRCIIVRCEQMFEHDGFSYTAICEDFAESPKGSILRNYTPVFEQKKELDDDGNLVRVYPEFMGWQSDG